MTRNYVTIRIFVNVTFARQTCLHIIRMIIRVRITVIVLVADLVRWWCHVLSGVIPTPRTPLLGGGVVVLYHYLIQLD